MPVLLIQELQDLTGLVLNARYRCQSREQADHRKASLLLINQQRASFNSQERVRA